MAPPSAAVHRTILVVDVAGFGDTSRTNLHQVTVRDGLYDALICAFHAALIEALRTHNELHAPEEQIRLRMALHAGEIHYDDHGVVGRAVNLAFRLLDAAVLKSALAQSESLLALITSGWFFEEVVLAQPESWA